MKLKRFVEKNFFILYFAVIVVAFIWQIFTSGTQTFQQYSLGTSSDEEYEILDGQRLDTVFRIGQDNPDGFIIYNYKK